MHRKSAVKIIAFKRELNLEMPLWINFVQPGGVRGQKEFSPNLVRPKQTSARKTNTANKPSREKSEPYGIPKLP